MAFINSNEAQKNSVGLWEDDPPRPQRLAGDRYSELDAGKHHRRVTLIVDEFAAFAIPEFIEFMDRARGAGIGIVFAHQSRADLRAVTPEFQDRIEANSNTVIVSGVKSSEDAEYFAGQPGTRTVKKETVQVEGGFLGQKRTGMKSIRETEEFETETHDKFSQARLIEALEKIRNNYMTGSKDRYLDLAAAARSSGLTTQAKVKRGVPPSEQEIEIPSPGSSGPDLWS